MVTGRATRQGFTLIELLLAVAIFSLLAMLAYGTLSRILSDQQRIDEVSDRLIAIQKAVLNMERDLLQITNRSIREDTVRRDELLGDGEGYGEIRLEFTRTGHPNPNNLPRGYQQRVAYAMPANEEKKLYRYTWPVLDRSQLTEPHKVLLLENVNKLQVVFYDRQGQTYDVWPNQANQQPTPLPYAIEIKLELEGYGELRRLIVLPVSS
ncbi:MAG: type II secretion system minor pseudopilin GspJ [Gammaproteobacteria bacterium]|nr:type II secretion system minor pseudopilin GspJ [Gammaproteobacteria bacterium]MDH5651489.1 type II secretion system minor pseudopilin GspJ [Gammaproteobacteria bacterium]